MTARDETPIASRLRNRNYDASSYSSVGEVLEEAIGECEQLERALSASQAECERLRTRLARVEAAARELTGLLEKAADNDMLYLSPDTEAAYKALRTALLSEQKDDRARCTCNLTVQHYSYCPLASQEPPR